ncbi:MAG: serine/threonine protein kinase [Planctomycetota bacterium]|nr:MAG: serine/threonine protein kinase [Planctomycetota bacterium]
MSQRNKVASGQEIIQGFRVVRLLGKGSMGDVYQAIQLSMDRPVAIKILSKDLSSKKEYVDRFFAEAKSVAKLNHPNIISGIDVGKEGELYYFIMEYVEGQNLHKMIKDKGPLPFDQVLDIAIQITKALDHAFENNLVHRDIKPDNIMLTSDGTAKLCDLGLAKKATAGLKGKDKKTMGTPQYISPEQALGQQDIDIRSDIYSLGATLYHLLTGSPPFDGDDPVQIMKCHLEEPFPPLEEKIQDLPQRIPPRFLKILDKMVEKDRNERYQTPQELLEELEALKYKPLKKSARVAVQNLSSPSTPLLKESPFWLKPGIGIAIGLVLLGMIIYLAGQKPQIPKKNTSLPTTNSGWGNHNDASNGTVTEENTASTGSSSSQHSGSSFSQQPSTTTKYQEALAYQKKANEAFLKLRQYLLLHVKEPKKCLKEINLFISTYPKSEKISAALKLKEVYSKMVKTSEKPSLPKPVQENPKKETRILASIQILFKRLLAQKNFQRFLEQLSYVRKMYPKFKQVLKECENFENQFASLLEKEITLVLETKPLPVKLVQKWIKRLQIMESVGSEKIKKRIQQEKQRMEKKLAVFELEKQRPSFLVLLLAWDFTGAKLFIEGLQKNPLSKHVNQELENWKNFSEKLKNGYNWLTRQLPTFVKKKQKFYYTKKRAEFFRIKAWDPKESKLTLRFYGKNKKILTLYLRSALKYLIPVLAKISSPLPEDFLYLALFSRQWKTEWNGYGLSPEHKKIWGEIEGKKDILYPWSYEAQGLRFLREKSYKRGKYILDRLKAKYGSSSYFKTRIKPLTNLYQQIITLYYTTEKMRALLKGKVSQPKKNFYQIEYDFAKYPDHWDDWTPINWVPFSKDSEIRREKGLMLVKGIAQHPIFFDNDVEIRLAVKALSGRKTPANICVFLSEQGRKKPFWFLGIWFKIPNRNRLLWKTIPGRGDNWWIIFPCHGIFLFRPNRPNRPKSLYLGKKPRIYRSGLFHAIFYHKGKILSAHLGGSKIMARTENDKFDQGRICLYTGNKTNGFWKILIRGKVDPDWLESYIQQRIQQDVNQYRKIK